MTKDSFKRHGSRPRTVNESLSVRDLAEAGAKGRVLTRAETIAVCEALRARPTRVPNQFHSGT